MNGSALSLALYQEVLPKLASQRRKWKPDDPGHTLLHKFNDVAVFDCRPLPVAFVDDTGDAVYDELEATGEPAHLPFETCYLEFADEPRLVFVQEIITTCLDEKGKPIPAMGYQIEAFDLSVSALAGDHTEIAFEYNGKPPPGDFCTPNEEDDAAGYLKWRAIAKRVLAVSMLLTEELVINTKRSDPMPRVSRERKRTQKLPVSGDIRVLTINVPIVRLRAANATRLGSMESSRALHWRRGHWRIYGRGGNAEKTGWVRRCLVGDPDKGYVRKTQYRLVHRPVNIRILEGGPDDATVH